MMGHLVSQRPQNKPMYLPSNNGPWDFRAYNYEEDMLTQHVGRRERMSLDETRANLMSLQPDFRQEKLMKLEEEVTKKKQIKQQSSSSSRRFVSLLNTFFSQLSSSVTSKKKRAISSSWKDGEEGDSRPGNKKNATRRRRNSMSQFLSSRVADSRSLFDNHKQVLTLSRDRDGHGKSVVSREEMNFEEGGEFEFPKQRLGNPDLGRDGRNTWQDKEKVSGEEDEGYGSDSSSDLFELKNF